MAKMLKKDIIPPFQCSLHWMLSYTVNTTFRADEIFWDLDYENSNTWTGNGPNSVGRFHTSSDEYNNWAQHPPYGSQSATYSKPYYANAISCDDKVPDSKAPWEMGKFVEQIEILNLLSCPYIPQESCGVLRVLWQRVQ